MVTSRTIVPVYYARSFLNDIYTLNVGRLTPQGGAPRYTCKSVGPSHQPVWVASVSFVGQTVDSLPCLRKDNASEAAACTWLEFNLNEDFFLLHQLLISYYTWLRFYTADLGLPISFTYNFSVSSVWYCTCLFEGECYTSGAASTKDGARDSVCLNVLQALGIVDTDTRMTTELFRALLRTG